MLRRMRDHLNACTLAKKSRFSSLFRSKFKALSGVLLSIQAGCLSLSLYLPLLSLSLSLSLSYPSQASCLWIKCGKFSKMSLEPCCSTLTQKTAICNLPLGIVSPTPPLNHHPFFFIPPSQRPHVLILQPPRKRAPVGSAGIEVLLNKWSSFRRGAENARCSPCAGAGACCKLGGFFKDRQSSFGIHAR